MATRRIKAKVASVRVSMVVNVEVFADGRTLFRVRSHAEPPILAGGDLSVEGGEWISEPRYASNGVKLNALAIERGEDLLKRLNDAVEDDLGHCSWCEEAESETYLAHEGHDPECPFAAQRGLTGNPLYRQWRKTQ